MITCEDQIFIPQDRVMDISHHRFELTTSVVIGTDCIGSCKFNYHMITIPNIN